MLVRMKPCTVVALILIVLAVQPFAYVRMQRSSHPSKYVSGAA